MITIAFAVNDSDPVVLKEWELGEKGIIEKFLEEIKSKDRPILVGHNIFRFDIPVLVSRAFKYGLGTVWELNTIFTKNFSVDTLQCLLPSNNLYFKGLGLSDCAERLGIKNPTCPSSLICDYYNNENWDEIISHNLMDVEITRAVYKQIRNANFSPF
ncbi:MAG: ribonuclease H-like domain-containing protein [Promethearchaeota archaeon]